MFPLFRLAPNLDKNRTRTKNYKLKTWKNMDSKFIKFQHRSYFFNYDPNMHRRSLSAIMGWNASSINVKMESYVNKYGSTE